MSPAKKNTATFQQLIPTSFDPDNPNLGALAVPYHPWETSSYALADCVDEIAIIRVPPFWQMEMPIHDALRAHGIAPHFLHPENTPLGIIAVSQLTPKIVITEAATLPRFLTALAEKKIPIPARWILLHALDAPQWETPKALNGAAITAHEVHSLPGLPVLHQCAALARSQSDAFHQVEKTPRKNLPVENVGTCVCGKLLLKRV